MSGKKGLFGIYLTVVVLLLLNIVLLNSLLTKNQTSFQNLNLALAGQNVNQLNGSFDTEKNSNRTPSKRNSTKSADVYDSINRSQSAETIATSQDNIDSKTYSLYFFNPEHKKLISTKLQIELLDTLISLNKPKPIGEYYFVTNIDLEGNNLLVSIATRKIEEVLDTTNTNPEDYFFTIQLNTKTNTQIGLFSTTALTVFSQSKYTDYKLPWRSGEDWRTEAINPNYNTWWGWHRDSFGPALDFDPPTNSNLEILASASGKVVWKCSDKYGQSAIHVRTIVNSIDYGETLRYYHLDSNKLAVSTNQNVFQGQVLAKLSNFTFNRSDPGCRLPSDTVHLHFGFPYTPFSMDGFEFVENGQLYKDISLFSSQPSKFSITEPKNGDTLYLGWRYQIQSDLKLGEKPISKIELLENNQVKVELFKDFNQIFWYPQDVGERKLRLKVSFLDGLTSYSEEIKINTQLAVSSWKSDKTTKVNSQISLSIQADGRLMQSYSDNSGNTYGRLSLNSDIIANPNSWTEWAIVSNNYILTNSISSYYTNNAETKISNQNKSAIRIKLGSNTNWSNWIDDGMAVKYSPVLIEPDNKILQTVVGMDGYIYWREIQLYQVGDVKLM